MCLKCPFWLRISPEKRKKCQKSAAIFGAVVLLICVFCLGRYVGRQPTDRRTETGFPTGPKTTDLADPFGEETARQGRADVAGDAPTTSNAAKAAKAANQDVPRAIEGVYTDENWGLKLNLPGKAEVIADSSEGLSLRLQDGTTINITHVAAIKNNPIFDVTDLVKNFADLPLFKQTDKYTYKGNLQAETLQYGERPLVQAQALTSDGRIHTVMVTNAASGGVMVFSAFTPAINGDGQVRQMLLQLVGTAEFGSRRYGAQLVKSPSGEASFFRMSDWQLFTEDKSTAQQERQNDKKLSSEVEKNTLANLPAGRNKEIKLVPNLFTEPEPDTLTRIVGLSNMAAGIITLEKNSHYSDMAAIETKLNQIFMQASEAGKNGRSKMIVSPPEKLEINGRTYSFIDLQLDKDKKAGAMRRVYFVSNGKNYELSMITDKAHFPTAEAQFILMLISLRFA